MAGIYKIVNLVNGKVYVGCTINKPIHRWYHHKKTLRNNTHRNIRLQRAWNKYGESNFSFEILEVISNVDRIFLCEREHYFRTLLHAEYNISPTDVPGTLTDNQRLKLSNSLKKRYKNGFSKEHKLAISKSKTGVLYGPMTYSHKENISRNRKGKCVGINHPLYKGEYIFFHNIYGKEICHQWGLSTKYSLDASKISQLCNNKRQTHKGWSCIGRK